MTLKFGFVMQKNAYLGTPVDYTPAVSEKGKVRHADSTSAGRLLSGSV